MASYTYSVDEAAKEMGTGPKVVLKLIESGELGAAKMGSGYRVRIADVHKHIDLQISIQTAQRAQQQQAKKKVGQPQTAPVPPAPKHRGRKRNDIPTIPNFVGLA